MLTTAVRTIILYILLLVALRLLGKRQVGQMEPSEFVLMMLLANLATVPIEDPKLSIWAAVIPIVLVFVLEYAFSIITLRSIKARKLFCGKPVILIDNGKISENNLKRTRFTLDELTMALREQSIFDLSTVKYAILETNGQLSTLLFAKDQPSTAKDAGQKVKETELPVTIISDGRLMSDNLGIAGCDEAWVKVQLRKRKAAQKDVLLMTLDKAGHVVFIKKEK